MIKAHENQLLIVILSLVVVLQSTAYAAVSTRSLSAPSLSIDLTNALLLVVYPEKTASQVVYEQIITGIKKEFKGKVELVTVKKKFRSTAEVITQAQKIERRQPDFFIGLGTSGRKVGSKLTTNIPWVFGASRPSSQKFSGISQIADPKLVFKNFQTLAPKVKRVFFIYSNTNQWLIERAQQAAKEYNIAFLPKKVNNKIEAMSEYSQLMKNELGKGDAVWLPHDKNAAASSDKLIEPLLEAAWKKSFAVFASKPSYVKRGALFSLLPDNEITGQELVKMVVALAADPESASFNTTSTVKLAVNLRIASHLGFTYTSKQKGSFQLIFPTQ